MKLRQLLKSKINNAVVTEKKLGYAGSIGIDGEILKKADILSGEKVQVLNYNNGTRIETYVIPEENGSGKIILYGPAARCGELGDRLCILSYLYLSEDALDNFRAAIVQLDEKNQVKKER